MFQILLPVNEHKKKQGDPNRAIKRNVFFNQQLSAVFNNEVSESTSVSPSENDPGLCVNIAALIDV